MIKKTRQKRLSRSPSPAGNARVKSNARLLSRIPDAAQSTMPARLSPMLATLVDAPFDDPHWMFETKWDGVRALCYLKAGKIELVTRNGKEVSFRYPELNGLANSIDAEQAILDGEIVTLDPTGRSVFQWLQSRIGLKSLVAIDVEASTHPAVYCAFDLLYCDGFDLRLTPLSTRKGFLATILKGSDHLKLSTHVVGNGTRRFGEAQKARLEGIVAKLASSPYVEARSSFWLKIKTVLRQEVVIGGYTAPRGSREFFGALVVGLYDKGRLSYIGHVGGGFDRGSLEQVHRRLVKIKAAVSSFDSIPRTNEKVQWVEPRLVCEVKFAEWTAAGLMRQPIFQGLRDDKHAAACHVERPAKVLNKPDRRKEPVR